MGVFTYTKADKTQAHDITLLPTIQTYFCWRCNAIVRKPEIEGRGYQFNTAPDWIIFALMDSYQERHRKADDVFPRFTEYSEAV